MAEFCMVCWNKMAGTNLPATKYFLSKELELCEECGQCKPVVIIEKKYYYRLKYKKLWKFLDILWRIILTPYIAYKYRNDNRRYQKRAGL